MNEDVKSISIGYDSGEGTNGDDRDLERLRFVPCVGEWGDDASDGCDEALRIPRSSHRQESDEHNPQRSSLACSGDSFDVEGSGIGADDSDTTSFKQAQSFPTTQVSQFTPPLGAGDTSCCSIVFCCC